MRTVSKNDVSKMCQNLREVKTMAESLEGFDGFLSEMVTIKFNNQLNSDYLILEIDQDSFINFNMFKQYRDLIREFGKNLNQLQKEHRAQLLNLQP